MIPMYSTKIFTDIYPSVNEFLEDYDDIGDTSGDGGLPKTISTDNAKILYYLLYANHANDPIINLDENQFKFRLFATIWQYGPTWQKRLAVQDTLRQLTLSEITDDGSIADVLAHTGTDNRTISETGSDSMSSDNSQTTKTNNDVETITNHALNPEGTPATNAYDPLTYINEQTASKTDNDTDTQTWGNQSNSGQHSSSTGVQASTTANDTDTKTITKGKLAGFEHLLALLETDVTAEFLKKFKPLFRRFVAPDHSRIYVYDLEDGE